MEMFRYVIKDELGIHARPAGLLVKEASSFPGTVKIAAGGKEVDAKRILGIMSLGVKQGCEVTVTVDGDGEAEMAKKLQKFFQDNL